LAEYFELLLEIEGCVPEVTSCPRRWESKPDRYTNQSKNIKQLLKGNIRQ